MALQRLFEIAIDRIFIILLNLGNLLRRETYEKRRQVERERRKRGRREGGGRRQG